MSEAMSHKRDLDPAADGDPAMAIPLTSDEAAPLVDNSTNPAAGDVVEPSRALALADFSPPSLGTGERLLRLAYRLGIPGPTLAAPFRKPAKLRLKIAQGQVKVLRLPVPRRARQTGLRLGPDGHQVAVDSARDMALRSLPQLGAQGGGNVGARADGRSKDPRRAYLDRLDEQAKGKKQTGAK